MTDIADYLSLPFFNESVIQNPNNLSLNAKKVSVLLDLPKENNYRLSPMALNAFLIDLSWKSSNLEGCSYSLIDSKVLIESGKAPDGKSQADTQMILNHKNAIEFMMQNHTLSIDFFLKLNAILLINLSPDDEIGFRGGADLELSHCAYYPTSDYNKLKANLDVLISTSQTIEQTIDRAWYLFSRVPYLQSCFDANKRLSRLLASRELLSGLTPLSYNNINKTKYLESMLYFYETGEEQPLKTLFIESLIESSIQYKQWTVPQKIYISKNYPVIKTQFNDYLTGNGPYPDIFSVKKANQINPVDEPNFLGVS